jgi:predicted amidohydrolase YtcJ
MTQRRFLIGGAVMAALLLAASISCSGRGDVPAALAPDMVLLNGNVITVDAEDNVAQAIAVRDGKILAVGSDREIRGLVGGDTRVVDLDGCTATPGLLDSHAHFSGTSMLYVVELAYPEVKSIEDALEKIKAKADTLEPGEWIRGRGWDEGKLAELRYIYARDLDQVTPENPVYITHTMGHYGTANSYAMKLASISGSTPDPPAGTIDRYPDGRPTGVLKEGAQSLVRRLIPRFSREQEREGIIKIVEEFNKEGMTGVKDPGLGRRKWEDYRWVQDQGKLTVRVFGLWSAGKTPAAAQELIDRIGPFSKPYLSTGDDTLISGGVKHYLDGSGGARTGWLYQDWNKDFTDIDKGNVGYPVIDPDIYREQVGMFHDAGLHISTHAIGDRAIDWVMDSYRQALEGNPIRGLRHGIIHCNIPTDYAIGLMADMQQNHDAGYPEAQSTFTWWIGDTYAGNFGPARSLRLMPFRTYLDRGILWGGGSDFSVTPFPARYGIWASMERKPLKGSYGVNPFGDAESVDVRSALRSYTLWSARQMFLENKIGSIEVGKYADIAVWDKDLYSITPQELKEARCQMTLFEGRIVYRAPDGRVTLSGSR